MSGAWRSAEWTGAGFRQFYREWQPASQTGLPVLALHGSLTQSGMWNALAESAANVRLMCPDQRGFGLSDDPPGDACADFARDAVALADALLPGRFVVMGHSFACSVALEVARSHGRVAGAVLVDPVVRVPGAAPAGGPPAPNPERLASLEEAQQHFARTEEGEWTADSLKRFAADVMIADTDGGWRFPYSNERLRRLRAFTASPASDYDLFTKARAVRCPVLVFRGGVSKRFAAAAESPFMSAFAGEARCVVCPKSGHFPTTTEPGLVIAALQAFLAGLPKA
jgi:pimeloyl-ACP methyl ester carboxylesterase